MKTVIAKITDIKGKIFTNEFNITVLPSDNGKNNLLESFNIYISENEIDLSDVVFIIIETEKGKKLMKIEF